MGFTGRLGTPNTQFGNIVFAAVDGLGPGTPDFQVHQLTSTTVRVLFSIRVSEDALDETKYTVVGLGPSTVPDISSISYYDETLKSVVLEFAAPLTTGAQYSVTVVNVQTVSGEMILSAAKNFTANVFDPPRAVGAFLSKRGSVDILFDKPVGPFSSGASFDLRDADGGPLFGMVQAPWGSEDLPDTTLRVDFGVVPTADSYVIEFSGVVDFSLNTSAETVPLTLVLRSPLPYSSADVSQLQLTDAFVTDVSPDVLRTANVRVFFSCPVLDAGDTSNWELSASAGHRVTDDVDVVTAPAASDEPTLVALVNDLKSVFNAHLVIEQVHFAPAGADATSVPDATDTATAITLLNDLEQRIPSHFMRARVHSWPDTVHYVLLPPVPPGDLALACDNANDLAAIYGDHILAEYPLEFSTAYQAPVGEITAYALEDVPNGAFDVSGPYTYFADLRVVLDSEVPSVVVRATLTSEDGGSSTNPADYTGLVVARPADSRVSVLSALVMVDSHVDLHVDRNVGLVSDDPLVVSSEDGVEAPSTTELLSTLPTLFWAFNNALEGYRRHIVPGAAGHQVNDDVNTVSAGDYASLPLPSVLSSVNQVRLKVMAHMSSAIFHYHSDPSMVTAPPATDVASLVALVADLTSVLSDHLVKVGPHLFPGYRMLAAPVFDLVRVSTDGMVDGAYMTVSGMLQDSHVYNGLPRTPAPSFAVPVSHVVAVDVPFLALAVRPSLASALPRSALVLDEVEHQRYETDAVEVFFSKPMREVPLSSSNLPVTGGSIQQGASSWSSPLVASVSVTKMEPISYSVVASNLSDVAGNLIYT